MTNRYPPYKTYTKRSLGVFKAWIIWAVYAIIVFLGFAYSDSVILPIIFIGAFTAYIGGSSFLENRIFLKSIEFSREKQSINITVNKFNSEFFTMEYLVDDVNMEIEIRQLVYSTYFLAIRDKKSWKKIVKQRLIGGWSMKQFEDAVNVYKELKHQENLKNSELD